jgi:hypothetical protein
MGRGPTGPRGRRMTRATSPTQSADGVGLKSMHGPIGGGNSARQRGETPAWHDLTTYRPEHAAFVVRHALEAEKAVDFPIQTFGGTKNFLPQTLAAWERRGEAEEARREAETRADEQRRRDRDKQERRRRVADRRAALSDEVLAALRRRAEEALAADGVEHTRLGYDVLVKLKMDDLLEQERVPMPMRADGAHPPAAVMARG